MWSTFIPTAIAAAIIVSVVNLASEINNVRAARQDLGTEFSAMRRLGTRRGAGWGPADSRRRLLSPAGDAANPPG